MDVKIKRQQLKKYYIKTIYNGYEMDLCKINNKYYLAYANARDKIYLDHVYLFYANQLMVDNDLIIDTEGNIYKFIDNDKHVCIINKNQDFGKIAEKQIETDNGFIAYGYIIKNITKNKTELRLDF